MPDPATITIYGVETRTSRKTGNPWWSIRTDRGYLSGFNAEIVAKLQQNKSYSVAVDWDAQDKTKGILREVIKEVEGVAPPVIPAGAPGNGPQRSGGDVHYTTESSEVREHRIIRGGAMHDAATVIAARIAVVPSYAAKTTEELFAEMTQLATLVTQYVEHRPVGVPNVAPIPVMNAQVMAPPPTAAIPVPGPKTIAPPPMAQPQELPMTAQASTADPANSEIPADTPEISNEEPLGPPDPVPPPTNEAVPTAASAPAPAISPGIPPAETPAMNTPPQLFSGTANAALKLRLEQMKRAKK